MRSKAGEYLGMAAAVTAGVLLILQAGLAAERIRAGIDLCTDTVIPSLFAFMVFCDLIGRGGERMLEKLFAPFRLAARVFHLPVCTAPALCLGVLGGYPIGARMAARLKKEGRLTCAQAERLLCTAYGCSPAFLCGIGRLVFGSERLGLALWGCQLTATVVVGWVGGRSLKREENPFQLSEKALPFSERLVDSVVAATRSMGIICGFVLLFSVVNGFLTELPGGRWLAALCEVSVGCQQAGGMGYRAALVLVSGCCSLGGVSVWMQNACFLRGSGISMKRFFLSRLLHLPLSIGFALLADHFFPLSELYLSAFAPSGDRVTIATQSGISSVFLVICCLLLLLDTRPVWYNNNKAARPYDG